MVISFINEKGGSGKSTFCLNLATRLMLDKKEVMIVNCDPQDSISAVVQNRTNQQVILHTNLNGNGDVAGTLKSLIKKYEFVLVDTAGIDSVSNRRVMLLSDLVIIPTKPSQLDVDILQKMFLRVEDCQSLNESLNSCVVINQILANPRLSEREEMKVFIKKLIEDENPNIKLLKTIIFERMGYKRSFSDGLGISEYQDKICKNEFENFYQELKQEFCF